MIISRLPYRPCHNLFELLCKVNAFKWFEQDDWLSAVNSADKTKAANANPDSPWDV